MQEIWETCWQNCVQRILDDIIGAHTNTISRNDVENNLKKKNILNIFF